MPPLPALPPRHLRLLHTGRSARVLHIALAFAAFVTFIPTVHGAVMQTADDATLAPYFLVESENPEIDRFPLLSTTTTFSIAGAIADVVIEQSYQNDGTRPIHARYVFPASTRAAVHGLTMTVGNERIRARIKEREQAKQEFTQAKESGKNAALLEQERPNVFSMNLANLMPGQRIDVELHYTELLVPTAGIYELVQPTVVGPRYSTVPAAGADSHDTWIRSPYTREAEPPRYSFHLGGQLNAGMPIQDLTSPSHRIAARWDDPAHVTISLDPGEHDGGNRDFVLRYRLSEGRIESGLLLYGGEDGGMGAGTGDGPDPDSSDEQFFLLMLEPPKQVAESEIPPREYIFVVDVSGSMAGFPLTTAQNLLRQLIGGLRPTDTFNVLLFAGASRLWSPESRSASRANIDEAIAMLERERGGGGTELLAALQRAVELPQESPRSRSVLLVTDGYIAAEREAFSYIRSHLGRSNVFTFGVGSSVNRYLIEGIAHAGMGEPFIALDPDEARSVAARFREYVRSPVLTDIAVSFPGFDAYDVEPTSIPDVLADRPILIQGKWRGSPSGSVRITGWTGSGHFARQIEVSDAVPRPENRALRSLWARTRVGTLSDFGSTDAAESNREEIVSLGLRYDLLTRFTSFIAVRELVVNETGHAEHVDQALPLPAGVSDLAIGEMHAGDEPGLVVLVLGLILGASLLAGLHRRRICR
ncbi:MAG: VWA domain-containing protein [Candidatus Eisenbacteria bacterium]|uniref:VWA domain-containing protein n=1 Tax=Eiseniibacteriota bacterium TaxID=2212470 RepID=A0A956LXM3_UNCEI|nr:VWA domain-containing protein [Candidatus Eisenbacteria bacterium]